MHPYIAHWIGEIGKCPTWTFWSILALWAWFKKTIPSAMKSNGCLNSLHRTVPLLDCNQIVQGYLVQKNWTPVIKQIINRIGFLNSAFVISNISISIQGRSSPIPLDKVNRWKLLEPFKSCWQKTFARKKNVWMISSCNQWNMTCNQWKNDEPIWRNGPMFSILIPSLPHSSSNSKKMLKAKCPGASPSSYLRSEQWLAKLCFMRWLSWIDYLLPGHLLYSRSVGPPIVFRDGATKSMGMACLEINGTTWLCCTTVWNPAGPPWWKRP